MAEMIAFYDRKMVFMVNKSKLEGKLIFLGDFVNGWFFRDLLKMGFMDKDGIKQERGHAGPPNRFGDESIDQEEGRHGPLEFVELDLHGVNISYYKRSARMIIFFYDGFCK